MYKKFSLSLFYGLIFLVSTSGQVNLAAPLIGQEGQNLCWAASMEMLLQYHNPATGETQCSIAEDFHNMIGANASTCLGICSGGCDLDLPPTGLSACDRTLPGNNIWSAEPLQAANFDLLFSRLGYHSIEDITDFSWQQYQDEIDQCRPLIFNYNVTGLDITIGSFNHSVVADGYFNDTGVDFMRINDPWGDCVGDEYLVNKAVLMGTYYLPVTGGQQILQVNYMLSSVHHIFPKEDSPCLDCSSEEKVPEIYQTTGLPPDVLGDLVREHKEKFIGTRFGELIKYSYLSEKPEDKHFNTLVSYLSQRAIQEHKGGPINFEAVVAKTEIYEITYSGSKPALVATVRCDKETGVCFVEKIGLRRKEEPKRIFVNGSNQILLTNDPEVDKETNLTTIPYSIVRYPPYPFEFYRFQFQGKLYWYPLEKRTKYYLYGPNYTELQVAIPEANFLQGIKKYSKDDYKISEKGEKQLGKLNNKVEKGKYLKIGKYLNRNDLKDFLSNSK